MKPRSLLVTLSLAMISCGSPTDVEDPTAGVQPPQEPEQVDTLHFWGTVTLNDIPRVATVASKVVRTEPCPFVPYSIGCWGEQPISTVTVASTVSDAQGWYELIWSIPRSWCDNGRGISATFEDPELYGLIRGRSLYAGTDHCGGEELNLDFEYFGFDGLLQVDGEPTSAGALSYDSAYWPRMLIEFSDGTTDEQWLDVWADGTIHHNLLHPPTRPSAEFDSTMCSRFEGATVQIILWDDRASDLLSLDVPSVEDCAVRPIIRLDIEI